MSQPAPSNAPNDIAGLASNRAILASGILRRPLIQPDQIKMRRVPSRAPWRCPHRSALDGGRRSGGIGARDVPPESEVRQTDTARLDVATNCGFAERSGPGGAGGHDFTKRNVEFAGLELL